MSRSLPLFPLNIVAFPGEKLNLHIFESRYKKLVTDCLEQDAAFGMPSFLNNAVTSYGTKIKVLTVENTYAKGELDIKTQGTRVFRIIEFFRQLPGKPYAGAEVEEVEDIDDEDPAVKQKLFSALEQLYLALRVSSLYKIPSANFRAFDIGHHIGLSVTQEYQLLQLTRESERQQLLLQHLQRIMPVIL